ncbi:MAG: FAD-binding oxidoreductase, partial [Pseudomonadota bacterium]
MPPPRGFLNETLPGQPAPSWMEATLQPPPERSRLTGEISVDVGIVGAGYAGLSAALTLAERGVSVAVLEAHRVGWGASGRNGGHLDSLPRREIAFFERTMGVEDARAIVHAARDAAKLVRRRIREHAIDCDLTDGAVEVHHRRRFDAEAEDAVATLAERYGIGGLEFLPPARLTDWVRAEGLFGGVLHRESGS